MRGIDYYKKYEPVDGKWYFNEKLGSGAFGTVFEIERRDQTNLKAALKIISIPADSNEVESYREENYDLDEKSVSTYFYGFVEEFTKEIQLMSQLKGHSNIVSIDDYDIKKHTEGVGWDIFIRMELLTPMNKYYREHTPKAKDVIKLGIDICKALETCQKYKITHRDIKPSNIFISPNGDYKLGDFGVSRTLEKTSSGLSKKGTYTYMAPEVFKGEAYGSNVDIYSLGIVMYKILNNNLEPFRKERTHTDEENALTLRFNGNPIPFPANAEGRLAEIVTKACNYNPKERYESPLQMRMELESIYNDTDDTNELLDEKGCVMYFGGYKDESNSTKETYSDDETVGIFGEEGDDDKTSGVFQNKQTDENMKKVVQTTDDSNINHLKKQFAGNIFDGVCFVASTLICILLAAIAGFDNDQAISIVFSAMCTTGILGFSLLLKKYLKSNKLVFVGAYMNVIMEFLIALFIGKGYTTFLGYSEFRVFTLVRTTTADNRLLLLASILYLVVLHMISSRKKICKLNYKFLKYIPTLVVAIEFAIILGIRISQYICGDFSTFIMQLLISLSYLVCLMFGYMASLSIKEQNNEKFSTADEIINDIKDLEANSLNDDNPMPKGELSTKGLICVVAALILFFFVPIILFSMYGHETNYNSSEQQETSTLSEYTPSSAFYDNSWVELGNWNVPYQTYDSPVQNCKAFDLHFSTYETKSGDPSGEWLVYLRDINGIWNKVNSFHHNDGNETVVTIVAGDSNVDSISTYFATFDAIALVRDSNEPSDHMFEYTTTNFVFDEN